MGGEEDGALMPGIESLSQLGNLRDNPLDPFFGRSDYPSLDIRRAIAAEYLRLWNRSTDQASCDALVWAMEVDGPGAGSSRCIGNLQELQNVVLQHPSNETLIEKAKSNVQW